MYNPGFRDSTARCPKPARRRGVNPAAIDNDTFKELEFVWYFRTSSTYTCIVYTWFFPCCATYQDWTGYHRVGAGELTLTSCDATVTSTPRL